MLLLSRLLEKNPDSIDGMLDVTQFHVVVRRICGLKRDVLVVPVRGVSPTDTVKNNCFVV